MSEQQEQKKPEAGQWWFCLHKHRDPQSRRWIIGYTDTGRAVFQHRSDGELFRYRLEEFADWYHEPACTGWNWVRPKPGLRFPQYWSANTNTAIAYVRRDAETECVLIYRDGEESPVMTWTKHDEKSRTQLTKEQAEALVVKPVSEEAAPAPEETWPQYWSILPQEDSMAAYVRRDTAARAKVVYKSGDECHHGEWSSGSEQGRTRLTKEQAEALVGKPVSDEAAPAPEETWPKWFVTSCSSIASFPKVGDSTNYYRYGPVWTTAGLTFARATEAMQAWKSITTKEAAKLLTAWQAERAEVADPLDVVTDDDWVTQQVYPPRVGIDEWSWTLPGYEPVEASWQRIAPAPEKLKHGDKISGKVLHVRCRRGQYPKEEALSQFPRYYVRNRLGLQGDNVAYYIRKSATEMRNVGVDGESHAWLLGCEHELARRHMVEITAREAADRLRQLKEKTEKPEPPKFPQEDAPDPEEWVPQTTVPRRSGIDEFRWVFGEGTTASWREILPWMPFVAGSTAPAFTQLKYGDSPDLRIGRLEVRCKRKDLPKEALEVKDQQMDMLELCAHLRDQMAKMAHSMAKLAIRVEVLEHRVSVV